MECPRCRHDIADTVVECPYCHIQVAQYLNRLRAKGAPSAPKPVAPEKPVGMKNQLLIIAVILLMVAVGYHFLNTGGEKTAPVATAPPPPPVQTPQLAPKRTELPTIPPQEGEAGTATEPVTPQEPAEPDDMNASADSFNKGEKKIKKLVHATAPLLMGNPERILEDKK
jgi:hypothetical protein